MGTGTDWTPTSPRFLFSLLALLFLYCLTFHTKPNCINNKHLLSLYVKMSSHSYNTRQREESRGVTTSQPESTAFTRYASSSNVSRTESFVENPYFEPSNASEARGLEDAQYYSLRELLSHEGLDFEALENKLRKEHIRINDHLAAEFMTSVCNTVNPNFIVDVNAEINVLKELPALTSNSKERPDVIVFADGSKKKVILTVEVKSSPMVWAERKATLGAANMLRLLYNTSDDVEKFIAFAFPNSEDNNCIIEIQVAFENFMFLSTIKRYVNLQEGIERVRQVLQEQESLPPLPTLRQVQRYLIRLPISQCRLLCNSAGTQLQSSRHIVVKADDKVTKILYNSSECLSFQRYLEKLRGKDPPKFVIAPISVPSTAAPTLTICQYEFVRYSPLRKLQARPALRSLVEGIKNALDELHRMELSHNDIRLPNICFNDSYHVILIDVDRCWPLSRLFRMFKSSASASSCMYRLESPERITRGDQSDYIQLGWLILWILDDTAQDYHSREWKDQTPDPFVKKLIECGEYNDQLLKMSTTVVDTKTLASVLQERDTQ